MDKAYAHARSSEDLLYEGQPRFRDLVAMLDDLGFDYVGNLFQPYEEDRHVIYFDAVFQRRQPQPSRQTSADQPGVVVPPTM